MVFTYIASELKYFKDYRRYIEVLQWFVYICMFIFVWRSVIFLRGINIVFDFFLLLFYIQTYNLLSFIFKWNLPSRLVKSNALGSVSATCLVWLLELGHVLRAVLRHSYTTELLLERNLQSLLMYVACPQLYFKHTVVLCRACIQRDSACSGLWINLPFAMRVTDCYDCFK